MGFLLFRFYTYIKYLSNTHTHTHARTHAHTHKHKFDTLIHQTLLTRYDSILSSTCPFVDDKFYSLQLHDSYIRSCQNLPFCKNRFHWCQLTDNRQLLIIYGQLAVVKFLQVHITISYSLN